jgi:hypothetical protein
VKYSKEMKSVKPAERRLGQPKASFRQLKEDGGEDISIL